MTSISWNDIEGDDSSISDLSSEGSTHHPKPQQNELKKVLSSPPSKVTEADSVTRENTEKLNEHKGEKVWLYSPNFYKNREEEVNEIINKMQLQEEVNRGQQGWNILVKTEKAKQLIQRGYFTNGMKLKFFYSKTNDKQKNGKNKFHQNTNNGGYASPKNKFDKGPSIRNIKSKQKPTYKEKKVVEEEVKEKKKIKYVAKDQKKEEKKTEVPKQQANQPEKETKKETKKQEKQLVVKKEQPKQQVRKEEEHKEERMNGKEQQENRVQKEEKKEVTEKREESQEKNLKEREKYERDSEESLEEMKKKINKKKKNQKKKQKKQEFDPNNPFSFFDQ